MSTITNQNSAPNKAVQDTPSLKQSSSTSSADKAFSQAFLGLVNMMTQMSELQNIFSELNIAMVQTSVKNAQAGIQSAQNLMSDMGDLAQNWKTFQQWYFYQIESQMAAISRYPYNPSQPGQCSEWYTLLAKLPSSIQDKIRYFYGEQGGARSVIPSPPPPTPNFPSKGAAAQWQKWYSACPNLSSYKIEITNESALINQRLTDAQNVKQSADVVKSKSEALEQNISQVAAEAASIVGFTHDVYAQS
jgi:prophage DNA circulation protein